MRRLKVSQILSRHEHKHKIIRRNFDIPEFPFNRFIEIIRQVRSRQINRIRGLVKKLNPASVGTFMVFIHQIYRIDLGENHRRIPYIREFRNRLRIIRNIF